MSRRSRTAVDPEALDRIRAARAVEDAAIASLFGQVGAVDAAKQQRTEALVALDAAVRKAEDGLVAQRIALVEVAGLERAATILDITPTALRKLLRATPRTPTTADLPVLPAPAGRSRRQSGSARRDEVPHGLVLGTHLLQMRRLVSDPIRRAAAMHAAGSVIVTELAAEAAPARGIAS